MEKFKQLQKIKEIYDQGGNIIQYLKSIGKNRANTIEDILISYDFQAGSYIKYLSDNSEFNQNYSKALATVIDKLGDIGSLMEVGVGEATTLSSLLKNMEKKPAAVFGFDISWSRLKFAKGLLSDRNASNATLFTANLFEIPLLDNSIDVVYTSHSIEPNGGREAEALKELYRVAKNYLVLLEPSYEFADDEAKARMEQHGYITALYKTAKELGYNIVEHRLFDHSANPLNPTGLIIIEKKETASGPSGLVCPISRTALVKHNESLLYSRESFLAYPVIDGIPCLLKENSVLAIHLLTEYDEFKSANNIEYQ
ncbi:methyltransferase domain-containing protein [Chitinophaga sp. GCM10012297]|uniref:Methyltransferase domain-containing protein n=1 Tax=Chitinophaga chungangae TaxID=2821488 RepID=A0ABS3YH16_9BACT|nr:methyltransferase domain-containing protein [Chitinophaga chungangae]MBO9153966.1 methyltransferase domain-containing protein [Chitinophaga chungangae]